MESNFDFSQIDEILDRRGRTPQATIAILQDIQELYNYLPHEVFPYIAKALGIGDAKLYGVATFYKNFSLEPKGKCIIHCCDGTACHVRGSMPVLSAVRKELGLKDGQATTDDGRFTVETVACLGACGLAPVLTVEIGRASCRERV